MKMKGAYSALYVANIVFQSIFTLLFNIGLGLLLSWILVDKCGLPTWIYAVIITIAVVTGLISMIRFILVAMRSLDNLEKSHKEKRRKNENSKK
jgi:hypothetical protein